MNPDKRKRNRWGAQGSQKQPPAVAEISDQDALQAILTSAQAREAERQQQDKETQRESNNSSYKRQKGDTQNRSEKNKNSNNKDDYYGPSHKSSMGRDHGRGGYKDEASSSKGDAEETGEKQKPNFGLSGALASDVSKGNVYKGVVLKFQEPPEARTPNTLWRLYVFKGEEQIDILHISRQSAYLIGRNEEIADICVQHPSCSSQHAVLQYRAVTTPDGRLQCQPYIMDLESTNGTFLNGVQIDSARYYQLKKGDVLKFGASTREYVLLTATATSTK